MPAGLSVEVAVKERPILFSGPMVRAILGGRKTQTRRVINPQPVEVVDGIPYRATYDSVAKRNVGTKVHRSPYGHRGDLLWVRETWDRRAFVKSKPDHVYRATARPGHTPFGEKGWTPAIHMNRFASRITLEVTGVRVERLQEISEADAKSEGIRTDTLPPSDDDGRPACICYVAEPDDNHAYVTAKSAFQKTWDNINAKRAPWSSNPWVWCVEFKRV